MAIFNSVALGKSKGSIGGVTFTSWKGLNVAKQKATSVANPRSEGQTAQRSIFKTILDLFLGAASIANIGFRGLAVKMSAYNAFMSENLKNGSVVQSGSGPVVNPLKLIFSKGRIEDTSINNAVDSSISNLVSVSWNTSPQGNQRDSDKAKIILLNKATGLVRTYSPNTERSEGQVQAQYTEGEFSNANCFAYLFFENELTKDVSDSAVLAIS